MTNPKAEAITNVADLQFPQDLHGFTSDLRAAGTAAIGRMHASDDKFDIVIATLKVLGKYAVDKLAQQKTIRAAELEASEAAEAAEAARHAEDEARELARLNKLHAQIGEQIAARTAEPVAE